MTKTIATARKPRTKATAAKTETRAPAPAAPKAPNKVDALIDLLRRPEGATIDAMMSATGWQAHSVRGAIAGTIKKKPGLTVLSEKTDAGRIYRIPAQASE